MQARQSDERGHGQGGQSGKNSFHSQFHENINPHILIPATWISSLCPLPSNNRPVAHEELFFLSAKRCPPCDDGPQRGGHLHRDKQKNDDPGVEARVRPGVRCAKILSLKPQAEDGRDEPENQMQRAHPASDSVDCEKIHATGAKPMSRIVISMSSPASSPQTSTAVPANRSSK